MKVPRSCRHRLAATSEPLGVLSLDLVQLAIERLDRMKVGSRGIGVPRRLPPLEECVRGDAGAAAELGDGNPGGFRPPLDFPDDRLLFHIRWSSEYIYALQRKYFRSAIRCPLASSNPCRG